MTLKLTPEQQTLLDDTLYHLESQSSMECVVVFYERSGVYRSGALWLGNIALWLSMAAMLVFPTGLELWLSLAVAVLVQLFGIGIGLAVPGIRRMLTSKAAMQHQCKITAHAIFQKARLFQTSRQSGMLVFVSMDEQQVILLWDLGIGMKIPIAELQQWQDDFQSVFQKRDVVNAVAQEISDMIPTAARYMPSIPGNANELPNRLNLKF